MGAVIASRELFHYSLSTKQLQDLSVDDIITTVWLSAFQGQTIHIHVIMLEGNMTDIYNLKTCLNNIYRPLSGR